MTSITIQQSGYDLRVDSRVLADKLGVDHKASIQLIDKYADQLKRFGPLPFEMGKGKRLPQGGNAKATRYALLNRSQAELLLTFSRNTPEAIELKIQLIAAFDHARESLESNGNYIPFYHTAHNQLQTLVDRSGSSVPASIHHMNLERLINKTLGIQAGARHKQPPEVKMLIGSLMALATRVIRQAIDNGQTHKQAYQVVKERLKAFAVLGNQGVLK